MTELSSSSSHSTGALIDGFLQLAVSQGFLPTSFITLTYDRGRFEGGSGPSRNSVIVHWKQLVRKLNQHVGGKRYYRKWGHSYFGYVMGVEQHKDGVFHAHAVVDNWIDWALLHEWWIGRHGFAWIKPCEDDPMTRLRYVLKYVVKSDQSPSMFFQRRRRIVDVKTGRTFPEVSPTLGDAVKVPSGAFPPGPEGLDLDS